MRYLTAHLYRRLMTRGRIIGLTALASVPALVFVRELTVVRLSVCIMFFLLSLRT